MGVIADPFRAARLLLSLRQQGVTSSRVLGAMETIDRSAFVDPALRELGFEDCSLPIGCGQTLPPPSVTGTMLQALQLPEARLTRILLIGAGCGYLATLLAQFADQVHGVERYQRLTDETRARLVHLGIGGVSVRCGNGLDGWPEKGPFDRIVLAGTLEEVPQRLFAQLAPSGRLLAARPTGRRSRLVLCDRDGGEVLAAETAAMPALALEAANIL